MQPDTIKTDLTTLDAQIKTCDARHHFYHYQASAFHLWNAETLRLTGKTNEARAQFGRAVFQDHINADALFGRGFLAFQSFDMKQAEADFALAQRLSGNRYAGYEALSAAAPLALSYDKHTLNDAAFCRDMGRGLSAATGLHDAASALFLKSDYLGALGRIDAALQADAGHANSHFLRGRCWFAMENYAKAAESFAAALAVIVHEHDAYHRQASDLHMQRGQLLCGGENWDLAIADFTKALDLHTGNLKALAERAGAYTKKGSRKMAEEDEERLKKLGG